MAPTPFSDILGLNREVNTKKTSTKEHPSMTHIKDVTNRDIKSKAEGEKGTIDYRLHFTNSEGKTISPWHSIPLYNSKDTLNYICEIPRNTRAKFEVATTEPGNPIKQDSKKGKPREYGISINWNYGMLPQTWEDPNHANEECDGYVGDNDPVDIVEIGDKTAVSGAIYSIKPIAALAMIDEGELDWKVIAIATSDSRCDTCNSVEDVEKHFPGVISQIREWFRTYKTFEGKPENKFALEEKAMNREYTLKVISETHSFWKKLVSSSKEDITKSKMAVGDVPLSYSPESTADETSEEIAIHDGVETIIHILEAVQVHDAEVQSSRIAQEETDKEIEALAHSIETENEVKSIPLAVLA